MKINERKLKNGQIKLTGYGASAEVGRSAFVIEDDKRRVLIECGLKIMPGDEPTLAPDGIKERFHELDAVLLSHAHVDHSGYLPASRCLTVIALRGDRGDCLAERRGECRNRQGADRRAGRNR